MVSQMGARARDVALPAPASMVAIGVVDDLVSVFQAWMGSTQDFPPITVLLALDRLPSSRRENVIVEDSFPVCATYLF